MSSTSKVRPAGSRWAPTRLAALIAAVGALVMASGLVMLTTSAAQATAPIHKSYVCKYVNKPGGGTELVQTGQNPIWVDNHSIAGKDVVQVGDQFADAQGFSVVIVANTDKLDPEPGLDSCQPGTPGDDVCPDGTDRAGDAVGDQPCDTEEQCPEDSYLSQQSADDDPCDSGDCPDQTSRSQQSEDDDCTPQDEVCPEGTDRAGEPVGDEPCDTTTEEMCPEGTDRAGEPVGDEPCDTTTTDDACPGDTGIQASVDECPEVKGTEAGRPPRSTKPAAEVLGTEATVPTVVQAGLAGTPQDSARRLTAQLLTGVGLLLLLAAGSLGFGRRSSGGRRKA